MKTKDIVSISLLTTLLAVCAWIYIPTTIPFTMQTFAVFLAMLVLGGKKGTVVIFIYLLLGLIGVPVFSGGTAGPAILFGPTGGYMTGWIFLGPICHWGEQITKKSAQKQKRAQEKYIQVLALLTGLVICYTFGTLWFINIYTAEGTVASAWTALSICVFPFIIPDLVKLALAFTVSKRIKKYIRNV